ncbi:T9SS type A sorting domain-containing protein [Bacteroidia bacterium]|nr:T9SS type A sorting domain-containing protein [Bacteroidia bacterium]
MKYAFTTTFFALISTILFGQSSTLIIKDQTNQPIPFASITVYKSDSMVADLLTDNQGKTIVNLKPSMYTFQVKSYGYSDTSFKLLIDANGAYPFSLANQTKITHTTVVSGSVKSLESLGHSSDSESTTIPLVGISDKRAKTKRTYIKKAYRFDSESAPAPTESIAYESRESDESSMDVSEDYEFKHDLSSDDVDVVGNSVRSGILTGGEINDFSKWTLWHDESAKQLAQQQHFWDFAPQGRYTIQLKNKDGYPMVDRTVKLVNNKGLTVWRAKTDNTGKAELWAEIDSVQVKDLKGLQIIVINGERSQLIDIEYQQRFAFKAVEISAACHTSKNVDIAFVVDATGSMGDEINYLKQEMNDVMYKSKMAFPGLSFRYANVYYRDTRDAYLYKKQDFTRTLSESSAFINQQGAGGGGDYEEAVEVGLEQAIDSLKWSIDARARILFVILDAPPHNTYDTRKKMKSLAKKAAAKGIRIIPIAASGINKNTELLMRAMALCTNGTYLFITDHSGAGNSHIRPTTDTFKVKSLNTLMVVTITNQIEVMDCSKAQQLMQDSTFILKDTLITIDTLNVQYHDSIIQRDTFKQLAFDWSYYPNPTNAYVYFNSSVLIPKVFIYDLRGTLVQVMENTDPETKQKIDLRQYANGTYLIHFVYEGKKYSGKVILIKELK